MDMQNYSKEYKRYMWLRQEAGAYIDGLESALNAFTPRNLDSLVFLRQNLRLLGDKCREMGMPNISAAADAALDAGPMNIHTAVGALLVLMRKAAHIGRNRSTPVHEIDAETGLLNAEGFRLRIGEYERAGSTQAAVGAIQVIDAEVLKQTYGEDVAKAAMCHVAAILSDQLREEDQVARMGPFEFAVLLPMEDSDGLNIAMRRIDDTVGRHPFPFPDGKVEKIRIAYSGYQLGIDEKALARAAQPSMTSTIVGTFSGLEAQAAPDGPTYRVGVCMRNETTASVLGSLLERAGYQVVLASEDPAQRLAPFARSKLHVVIMDETEHWILKLRGVLGRRRTSVVAIVESNDAGQWALNNGAREFLPKPVRTEILLAAVKRLVRRGRQETSTRRSTAGGIVVASDDAGQLIALSSSLQKQGNFVVHLGRGADDAVARIKTATPAVVIIDMAVRSDGIRKVLEFLSGLSAPPAVIMLVREEERPLIVNLRGPQLAGIMIKPVGLRTLHTDVATLAARPINANAEESQEVLRGEITRVMRAAMIPPPAPPGA